MEVVGVIANSSLLCYNSSYFSKENVTLDIYQTWSFLEVDKILNMHELFTIPLQLESRVPCLEDELIGRMDYKLEIFWNIAFRVMIVTAMCGNCAVLWIVFRK